MDWKKFLEEIEAFTKVPTKIKLDNGQELEIPPLSWKKELILLKKFGEFLENCSKEGIFSLDDIGINNTGYLLSIVFKYAPDLLTNIVSIIVGKPEDYIEENFSLEDVVRIVLPFLAIMLKRIEKIYQKEIQPMLQMMKKNMTKE